MLECCEILISMLHMLAFSWVLSLCSSAFVLFCLSGPFGIYYHLSLRLLFFIVLGLRVFSVGVLHAVIKAMFLRVVQPFQAESIKGNKSVRDCRPK